MATLVCGDCRLLLKCLAASSVAMIVTDPPYFIDGMADCWNDEEIRKRVDKAGVISGLPVGMKFDRRQGAALQTFMEPLAREFCRVLKPGGFCVVFSQARLYHRMAMSLDLAGFEIRDMLVWKYEGQPKAFSQNHFIKKNTKISEAEKNSLMKKMAGLKTPQLKPQIEPMVLAQKPKSGTYVDNWLQYGVGLMDCRESLDGRFPGNVLEVSKRDRDKVDHLTPKPVELIAHLIRLFTGKGQVVLDPFMGSGAHGLAAVKNCRKFIGFEIEPKYFDIASERLKGFIN